MRITLPDRYARDTIEQGWYDHVAESDHTEAQQHALVAALMTAYETELDGAVEDGQVTLGNPTEAVVPDHLADSSYWEDAFSAASIAMYGRYVAIEAAALGQ